jgi:hypothetical protein
VSPLDGVNGARRNLLARIGLAVGRGATGAGGRSGNAGPSVRFAPRAVIQQLIRLASFLPNVIYSIRSRSR